MARTTVAQLEAQIAELTKMVSEAKTKTKAAKKRGKRGKKRIPIEDREVAPFTCAVSMERRYESFNSYKDPKTGKTKDAWGHDHCLLRFLGDDEQPHPIGSKLNPDDETGFALRDEIMAYAKKEAARLQTNSKVRFDPELGAWKGRAILFPERIRRLCEYKVLPSTK